MSVRLCSVVAGGVLGSAMLAAAANAPLAPPLGSAPLTGPTGLRVLVPNSPPFVFDVDSSRVTVVRGIPARSNPSVWAVAVGANAVLAAAAGSGRAGIYAVTRTGRAKKIGTGGEVVAAEGGRAVWLKIRRAARNCVLRRVRLDGRTTAGPDPVSCSAHLADLGGAGLLVQGGVLRDPLTRRPVARAPVWAIAGRFAIGEATFGRPLPLTDLRSGQVRDLRWPSRQDVTDEAVVHPDGRLVAVGFGDFIPRDTTGQVSDVWLLDMVTMALRHLPDMPAALELKNSGMTWTADGRLVWLGFSGARRVVAVWRPGDERIRVRAVRMPTKNVGNDSFVVWGS